MGVGAAVALLGVLIGLYVAEWATSLPTPVAAVSAPASSGGTQLTLETVAAAGPKYSPSHPDWVSYLVRKDGKWLRSTIYTVPANSIVHVTIYQYDGDSGLRNPFLGRPQGLVGPELVDGKPLAAMAPDQPSHTFAVPELGVLALVAPVADDAKNECEFAPCTMSMAHRTMTFTFRTGKPGHYRWQCFVPCAAGFTYGFGGPMQTIGYMDGFLDVA